MDKDLVLLLVLAALNGLFAIAMLVLGVWPMGLINLAACAYSLYVAHMIA